MESGIKEAAIELLNELTALVHKANQLLDIVITHESEEPEEPERPSPILRRRPGLK